LGPFRLILLSAMYENGGNTLHRMLDGHPELFVYPFESQLGTPLVADFLAGLVPFRYRWPELPLSGDYPQDYELLYDEEMKVRLRTPERSKFKHAPLELNELDRKRLFLAALEGRPRTRAAVVEAFFRATFDSWKNLRRTDREKAYVGYSPVLVLDTEKVLADFPNGHIVHVVRNPYSGFADTKRRPFPLSLERYAWTWNLCQHMALVYAERYPNNFHLLRFEDLVADPRSALASLCERLGVSWSDTCLYPSWNGSRLEEVYPWGTIRAPTPQADLAAREQLSGEEKEQIRARTIVMLRLCGYAEL
jgi:hypothetical protein